MAGSTIGAESLTVTREPAPLQGMAEDPDGYVVERMQQSAGGA